MTTLTHAPRRRALLSRTSAVLVTVGVALSTGVATSAAAPLDAGELSSVSGFLSAQLASGGDHFSTTFDGIDYPDHGLSADAVLALNAIGAGRAQADATTAYLQQNVGGYIGAGGETYAGATGKLLVVAASQGVPPTSFGGVDLVARLDSTLTPSGRFSDVSEWGDYSNTLGQSWAIIGLSRVDRGPAASAVDFLRDQQCQDGGFRLDLGGTTPCVSDPDATAMAVQALVAASDRTDPDVAEAVAYLGDRMGADGGVGGAGPTSAPNGNSTGLAAAAFAAAGDTARAGRARSFLGSLFFGCDSPAALRGGIAYDAAALAATESSDQVRRTTAQAAVGLSGQSYVTVSAAGNAAAPGALDCAGAGGPSGTGSLGSLGL
ncbi:prenyltransferase/squalene oxidase repeat-containing protein [Dietzia sp. UBA5065]|jgi:hypothetical protein|uniref:prenyltransferase/squalene oxidase repeat-containing protein n=1 Tax=Dietzia sp. UBA5065 TaxID=1946422 RepID=UPI0025BD0AC1|nr:prenyltransferase/squalene oxidase repeat-containing protein [Dietzia sp. UBA5065]HMT50109.1 prenyltransferase/squalene oxidase repeat-containing protein [Dietzia sp.]